MTELDVDSVYSTQLVQSPLRYSATSDLQSPQGFGSLSSSISTSRPYDHTSLKWKSLSNVYAKCKMSIIELEDFREAIKDEAWKKTMTREIMMIEKNSTWELVDKLSNKPII